jgi:hypothetical protein
MTRGRCLDQIVVWAMLDRDAFTLAELTRHLTSLAGRTAVPVDALQSSLQRLDLAFVLGEDAGVYHWRVPCSARAVDSRRPKSNSRGSFRSWKHCTPGRPGCRPAIRFKRRSAFLQITRSARSAAMSSGA